MTNDDRLIEHMARMAYAAHAVALGRVHMPVEVWDNINQEAREPYYAFATERLEARRNARDQDRHRDQEGAHEELAP